MSMFSRFIDRAAKALDLAPPTDATDRVDASVRRPAPAATAPGLTPPSAPTTPHAPASGAATAQDRAAIARYDYLMQTAEPQQIEMIHRDAFARLTPAQRTVIEQRMRAELPPHERPASSSAPDLARTAARAEAARPGRLRGLLGRAGGGAAAVGAGGAVIGVLGAVAGGAVLSSVAGPLLEQAAGFGVDFDAVAESMDLGSIAEGLDVGGMADGALGAAGEHAGGIGETVSGWGEQLSNLEIPGLGDIFGR